MVTVIWYMARLCFLSTYWTRHYRGSSNMWQKSQTCHVSNDNDHVLYTYNIHPGTLLLTQGLVPAARLQTVQKSVYGRRGRGAERFCWNKSKTWKCIQYHCRQWFIHILLHHNFLLILVFKKCSSTLPSAAKSNKSHYQSKVFVCVSVISWHMWIILQMRSIGF